MKYIKILFAFLFLISLSLTAEAAKSEITDLRWTSRNDGDPPFVRIALELTNAVHAEASMDSDGKNFELLLKNTSMGNAKAQYDMDARAINYATISEKDGNTYLNVSLSKAQNIDDISIFALRPDAKAGKSHRLVVDIPIPGATQTYKKAVVTPTDAKAVPKKKKKETKAKKETTEAKKTTTEAKKTTTASTTSSASPLKGRIICLDPGHGGTDVGAIGKRGGKEIYEKDITLSIALPLRDMLTAAGAKVVMTRTTDKDVYGAWADAIPELQARCDVANKAKADVFISIHIDSFSNGSVDGTTTYYYGKTGKDLLLAQMMHQSILSNLAIPDRGVKSNDFYVNVNTKMPSVLMEMGFISNSHRLQMLTSTWGPKSIAKSFYTGLLNYFAAI